MDVQDSHASLLLGLRAHSASCLDPCAIPMPVLERSEQLKFVRNDAFYDDDNDDDVFRACEYDRECACDTHTRAKPLLAALACLVGFPSRAPVFVLGVPASLWRVRCHEQAKRSYS